MEARYFIQFKWLPVLANTTTNATQVRNNAVTESAKSWQSQMEPLQIGTTAKITSADGSFGGDVGLSGSFAQLSR